jgi:5-(aminomethyl)-3-furanmethanol phosphate kinase
MNQPESGRSTCRVVKLGGSLLDLPDLPSRLRDWLQRQPKKPTVLLVGGGRMVDMLRAADRLHELGETVSHWLCIRVMTIHAEMLAALLPEAVLRRSLAQWAATAPPSLAILDPWAFLREEEPQLAGGPLPASWQVTSDSIAARFAQAIGAGELTLLKSAPFRQGSTLAEAAATGYLDSLLPSLRGPMPPIRWVDLRKNDFSQAWF